MSAALPRLSRDRLRAALYGDRRVVVMSGLTPPEQRDRCTASPWAGSISSPRTRGSIRWARSASHVIGFADTGGEGVAGAELAFDDDIRARRSARARRCRCPSTCGSRRALENELVRRRGRDQARGRRGHRHRRPDRRSPGHGQLPDFDPNRRGETGDAELNRVASAHYEMGSIFKAFTVAAGLDTGLADMTTTFDASRPAAARQPHHPRLPRREPRPDAGGGVPALVQHRHRAPGHRDGRRHHAPLLPGLGLLDAAPMELHESAAPRRP